VPTEFLPKADTFDAKLIQQPDEPRMFSFRHRSFLFRSQKLPNSNSVKIEARIANCSHFAPNKTGGTRLACNQSIMSKIEIILTLTVIVVVTLDTIVRLVVVPHRRDKFVETLLDSMTEPEPPDQTARLPHASAALDDSLAESLLRHFEHSATSRRVLAAFTLESDGMRESEILSAVNRKLVHVRKRELPAAVVRRALIILIRANLAELNGERLELTTSGKRLHALLEVRSTGAMPAPAFVSP